jgi:hypothetical protein
MPEDFTNGRVKFLSVFGGHLIYVNIPCKKVNNKHFYYVKGQSGVSRLYQP